MKLENLLETDANVYITVGVNDLKNFLLEVSETIGRCQNTAVNIVHTDERY